MSDFDPYFEWLGILPSQQPVDYYRLLGVARFEANPATIAAAADQRLALVGCHQGGPRDEQARRLLAELVEARASLTDAQRKSAYDDLLRNHAGGGRGQISLQPHAAPAYAGAARIPAAQIPTTQLPPAPSSPAQTPAGAPSSPDESPDDEAAQPSQRRVWLAIGAMAVAMLVLCGAAVAVIVVMRSRANAPADSIADDATTPPSPMPVVPPPEPETPPVEPMGNVLLLSASLAADWQGPDMKRDVIDSREAIVGWTVNSSVEWACRIAETGYYKFEIGYAAETGEGEYTISADDAASPIRGTVRSSGTGGQFVVEAPNKYLVFRKTGTKRLTMKANALNGKDLMALEFIRLTYLGKSPSAQ